MGTKEPMDSVQRSTGQAILISDVVAHPLSQTLPKPTVTSWGTYHKVSMVLVEVRTDAGIVGVGEVLARFSPKAYAELIETSLKPRLIGQDARNIGALWQSMRRSLSGRAGGMLIEAIAGVDIALWDIMGKAAGMPIAKLLGGIGREAIEVYAAAVNWVDDAEADRELERYIGEGFPRIKVKMANPVREACRRIERLRKRAGDDIELCVDANWAYDLDQAIEVGRALSANGYFWFEEPLAPGKRARLRRTSQTLRRAARSRREQLYRRSGAPSRRQPNPFNSAAGCRACRRHIRNTAYGRLCRPARCGLRPAYRHVRHYLRDGQRASGGRPSEFPGDGMRMRS